MTSVGISGAAGRMGRLSLETLLPLEEFSVGGLYAPGHDGEALSGHRCSSNPDALRGCDVILEFTNPDVAPTNVTRWRSFDADVVIGTSGYDSERLAVLEDEWADATRRCLVVPNLSVGAVFMMRLSELAAPHFASAEIIEMHHQRKADAPSGTSLNTAARMGAARMASGRPPHGRGREIAPGALGAVVEGVAIHSVRAYGFVAHQEVILGGTGEYLTIRHDTTDLAAFTPGIVLALRSVAALESPLTVGLETILGL